MRTGLSVDRNSGFAAQHLAVSAPQADWRGPASEYSVKVGLRHMDMILKLSIEPAGSAANVQQYDLPSEFDAETSDPVVSRLVSALGGTGLNEDDGGVRLDAIRLALIVRWLGNRIRTAQLVEKPSVHPLQKWRLKLVESFIDQHLDKCICLADLAKAAGLSPMYFAAQFRAATGLRPHDFLLQRRIERSKELLAHPNSRLVEVALDVGFQTQAHFTTVFKRFVGTTPARWRMLHRAAA